MVQNLQVLALNQFNGGLNFRDDENNLRLTQTPLAQNFEIEAVGLKKLPGWEKIFLDLPSFVVMNGLFPYRRADGSQVFITVSYPHILILDPIRGNFDFVNDASTGSPYEGLINDGKPFGRQVGDFMVITDGANNPVAIDQDKAVAIGWKPSYSNDNKTKLANSYLSQSDNPGSTAIGFPTTSVFHKNRLWLNDSVNRRRLYVSRLNAFISGETSGFATMFNDNSGTDIDIAFFVNVQCDSDIVGLETISDQNLVVYCEDQLILLKGNHPPGTGFPTPQFDFDLLNSDLGALDQRLIVKKGDNDHYFISNKKTVYQLSLTDQFIQVKPKGLSDKIYPVFEDLKTETLKRGFLVNHRIKGELHFALPSKDSLRYPDQIFTLNYEDSEDLSAPGWSKIANFTPFQMRGMADIDFNNELYVVDQQAIYQANKGITLAGNSNVSIYQFPTLDFGAPKNKKRIIDVAVYASSSTGATVQFSHLWENGAAGNTDFVIPSTSQSQYGSAVYGTGTYGSKAGQPFTEIKFKIPNRVGKLMKVRIDHSSSTETFDIHKIVFRYKPLGQNN